MSRGSPSNAPAARALVTGIHGFTGRYLAEELRAAGYQVFGIARPGEPVGEDIHTCDIENTRAIHEAVDRIRPDRVVHLAAISHVADRDVAATYRVNLIGTLNLLEALSDLAARPQMVLLASSAQVYGNALGGPAREAQETAPANHYAVSKLAMEQMAKLWSDRLPITIVRPFNYTGVGQSAQFLIPKIVDHFRRGAKEIELGNIDVARDFSDVRDVAHTYRLLLESSASGQTLNICSGRTHSLRQVLNIMQEMAGYEIRVKVNPQFVRPNEVKMLEGDPRALRAAIGDGTFRPLADTLRWMFES